MFFQIEEYVRFYLKGILKLLTYHSYFCFSYLMTKKKKKLSEIVSLGKAKQGKHPISKVFRCIFMIKTGQGLHHVLTKCCLQK